MKSLRKPSPRRAEIRKNRPDTTEKWLRGIRADGRLGSAWVALGFFAIASIIVMLRDEVVQWRPGQYAPQDIVSRVEFQFTDKDKLDRLREERRQEEPRVYKQVDKPWDELDTFLKVLPDRVKDSSLSQLSPELQSVLDDATLAKLKDFAAPDRKAAWEDAVRAYMRGIRELNLMIIPQAQRVEDVARPIHIPGRGAVRAELTYSADLRLSFDDLATRFTKLASQNFPLALHSRVVALSLQYVRPTYELDEAETAQARNLAAERVPEALAVVTYKRNQILADRGEIDAKEFQRLKAENDAFVRSLGPKLTASRLGLAGIVGILTFALSVYVARFQPRVIRNRARAIGISALLLATLLLAALAGIGSSPLFVFGVAPTILVAMILTIAYDQRFAMGVAALHAVLVTLALDAPMSFVLMVWSGVATCCFLLDDVRTRSKLIEVGGATAVAMMLTSAAAGLLNFDPPRYLLMNALYAGAAGLAVGFVVLGILPFIEKSFRITTSMTLLELADASHPLLRRLSMEAPGTYNHSLQVATLSEEAAEAIGANSLLCRVAAYYHDVGKINKADYFVENQLGGQNRHMHLDPNLSLLIIIGHVKDGLELAREYNLPTSIFPFIQQHHGTTLVEYFYHRACTQQEQKGDGPQISDTQYRYPGPKPKSREIAVLMLSDAAESATRAMTEPTATRIESLVDDLATKRLHDGQFDECDLTMRDLERVKRSLVKTLLGIYHGRIAYPSNAPTLITSPPITQPGISRTA